MLQVPVGVLMVIGALVFFCLLGTLGILRAWPYPAAFAFVVVWLGLGAIQLVNAWKLPDPIGSVHTFSVGVRSTVAMLGGALVFVGSAATAFAVPHRSSPLVRSLAAVAVAVLSLPLAMWLLVSLGCMFDLGTCA